MPTLHEQVEELLDCAYQWADDGSDSFTPEVRNLVAAAPQVTAALENYQRLVDYLQRTANPEEWATHGDWKRLQSEADAALAKAEAHHEHNPRIQGQ